MRHLHDRLTRTHTFTLSEDETEIISGWNGEDLVEPGVEIIRDYVRSNRPLFTSLLMHARKQRAKNYRRRFGHDTMAPQFYVVERGSMTPEERTRLMNASHCDVIEVSGVKSICAALPRSF